ncbi:hypothetical protein [Salibacterium sp. K-3]
MAITNFLFSHKTPIAENIEACPFLVHGCFNVLISLKQIDKRGSVRHAGQDRLPGISGMRSAGLLLTLELPWNTAAARRPKKEQQSESGIRHSV